MQNGLLASPVVAAHFKVLKIVHVERPVYDPAGQYAIVVRNPIRRCLSAFNWRYHLVVETRVQEMRFPGEFEILETYGTFNNLCDALYDTAGNLNPAAANDWRRIHHLKEDISFYLQPLLQELRGDQVFALFAQEELNDGMRSQLGTSLVSDIHRHGHKVSVERRELSGSAKAKLRKFLAEEYACLEKLFEIADCPQHTRDAVLMD